MDYRLKVKINGVEIFEASEETVESGVVNTTPSITNVRLYNNACNGTMVIGATAQDSLVFDMLNPYKLSFDGDKVEFFIAPPINYEPSTADKIIEAVGDSKTTQVIDIVEINNNIVEDEEEGETPTAEDLADIAAYEEELTEDQTTLFEGEESEETTRETVVASEWTKVGEYYVNGQKTSDDMRVLTLTCYDGFCLMSDKFTPTNMTATVQDMFDDLRSQVLDNCGVTITAFEYPTEVNKQIVWNYLCSYREALGYLYGLIGGYATFTADGTADISWYSYTGEVLIKDDLTSYETTSAGEMVIEEIRCNKSTNTFREDYLTVGGGQPISFVNPFVDEEMLDAIFDEYKGIRFTGANVSCEYTDSLQAGEFVRVFTSAEYENYLQLNNSYNDPTLSPTVKNAVIEGMNSLGDVILISSQVINFYGNASTVITSMCQSESSKANVPMSPSDAKFANLYAETITTRDLVAEKADIDMLNVTNANVQSLVSGTIDANTVNVKNINGHEIKDGTIFARALDNEAVETLSGTKVYYQADAPTENLKVGDSWYKTVVPTGYTGKILFVWNGTEWVGTDLDAKLLRANTITAQEIASNTITSNNLATGSVTTEKLAIGTTAKKVGDDNTKAYTKNVPSNANYVRIKSILGESVVNNGTLVDCSPTNVVGLGKNLIDKSMFTDGYHLDVTTGLPSAYSGRCATLQPIDVSDANNVMLSWNASKGIFAIYSLFNNGTLVKRAAGLTNNYNIDVKNGDALYLAFYDCTVSQLNWVQCEVGTSVTPYSQYTTNSLNVNYGTLRSAGTVHDELDLENGKIIRRVGSVDLGSLNYSVYNSNIFYATLSSLKTGATTQADLNIVCAKYPKNSSVGMGTMADKTIGTNSSGGKTNNQIAIKDSGYTSASAFKSAMSGVYLNYELATPIEEPISFKGNVLGATSTITFKNNGDAYGLHQPLTSNVEWWNIPENVVGNSNIKSLDSILRRVQIDNDSVDILDASGNTLASYGEKAIIGKTNQAHVEIDNHSMTIKDNDVELFKANGQGYYKESVASTRAEDSSEDPVMTYISMPRYVVAIISIKDANGNVLTNYQQPSVGNASALIDGIYIYYDKSALSFPLTIEYMGTSTKSEESFPYMLDFKGNARACGYANTGMLKGFFGSVTFSVPDFHISGSTSQGINIYYEQLMDYEWIPYNFNPIGVVGVKSAGTGNNYIFPYRFSLDTDDRGLPRLYVGFRNTSSTARTIDCEFTVLYGAIDESLYL